MASKRRFGIRFDATGKEEVVRSLKAIGDTGKKAFDGIDKAITPANRNLKALDKTSNAARRSYQRLVGLAATAGFAFSIRQSLAFGEQLLNLSTRIGTTTEGLSELRYVGEVTGVRFETLAMGMQRMTRRVAEAAQGTGEAAGAIKELGLSAEALTRLTPEEMLEEVADAMQGVGSQTDKTRLAMRLFDSEGVALLQFMDKGSAGIRELRAEAKKLGASIDEDTAQRMAEAEKEIANMNAAARGLSQTMATELAPRIADILKGLNELIRGEENTSEYFNALKVTVLTVAAEIERANPFARMAQQVGLYESELQKLADNAIDDALQDLREAHEENTRVIEQETETLAGYVSALRQNAEAQKKSTLEVQADNAVRKARLLALGEDRELTKAQESEIRALVAAMNKSTVASKDNKAAVSEMVAEMQQELELLQMGNALRAEEEAVLKATELAKKNNIKMSAQETETVRQLASEIARVKENKEAAKQAAQEWAKQQEELQREFNQPFENALDGLQDSIKDKIRNGFEGGMDDALDIVKDYAAEMATLFLFRPQVFVQGGITGATDAVVQGSATAGYGAGSGGMGGLSNIGSVTSLASNGFGFVGGALSDPLGALRHASNSTGFSAFELGKSLGLEGTGLELAQNAGAALPGAAIGGLISNIAGLGSGNMVQDAVLGQGAAMLGNYLMPGVGSILGAVAGNLVSGLFGNKDPNPASVLGASGFTATGQLQGVNLQSNYMSDEAAASIRDSVNSISTQLAAMGLNIAAIPNFQAGVDTGTGFFSFDAPETETGTFRANNPYTVTFNPEDEASVNAALGELAKMFVTRTHDLGEEIDQTLLDALGNIETAGRDVSAVMEDIALLANFEDIFAEAEEPLSAAKQAMDGINERFDYLTESASRLGLEMQKIARLEKERTEQLGDLLAGYNAVIADEIAEYLAPGTGAVKAELARFEAQLEDLSALGAAQEDFNRAERLHALKMQEILQKNGSLQNAALDSEQQRLRVANDAAKRLQSQLGSINDFLFELDYGRYTLDNPTQNAAELKSLISDLDARAQLGDLDAREQLFDLAPMYLDLVGEQKRFNDEWAEEQQFIRDIMQGQRNAAERQLSEQERQAELAQEQINVMQSGFAALLDASNLSAEVAGINATEVGAAARLAFSADNPNEIAVRNKAAIESAGLWDSTVAILAAMSPGVVAGAGRRSLFFETQNNYATQALDVLKAMGVPGYAKGGNFSPGLAMVGEEGMPELVRFDSPGRVYSGNDTRAMLAMASNDNSTIQNELRGLRDDVRALTSEIAKSGTVTNDTLAGLQKHFGRLEKIAINKAIAVK